ncbi:HAAS signaling domain-containing protein [Bacillus sp. T33-2]|uniref:HAAS signaling domain-containing protein n=1 Tax=Bacillus sp. T33-2 TaxID=2054168 RepID=UPI000C791A13|nr:hypothetical protein [Bacillus sp. T33-2]PLR90071.1 hypothetical protein CVD19_22560 [Bacillus sp. T33-2]
MTRFKQDFLDELNRQLGNHPDKEQILLEYESHISELACELEEHHKGEHQLHEQLITRIGSPEEIAKSWREELSLTPRKTQWLFILANVAFFAAGSLLTILNNLYGWGWVQTVWVSLTSIPSLIIFMYMFFWALLGYEIGKGFGHAGRTLLKKTFIISLVPNLLLMGLTLFHIIPHKWFQPLLSPSFIIKCVLFTVVLYPICLAGYKWGKNASV